jgi:hypothetical protein
LTALWLLAAPLALFGCSTFDFRVQPHASDAPSVVHPPTLPDDVFVTLKSAKFAHSELCTNDGNHPNFPNDKDRLTAAFCQDLVPGGQMPEPHGLADLLKLLNLDFKDPNGENGAGGNPGFALLGHSSALTARKVSSITPTAFVFTPPPADGSKAVGYTFLAYDPGEQFVEVVSHDKTTNDLNLYLVLFDKECTHAPGGCTNADLLTPNLTSGWSNVRIYETTTDLNNTIADCKQCHAPVDNKGLMLRMQEIAPPFTHWFSTDTLGGQSLLKDFHAAHGTSEDYGPIPAALIDKADPGKMAALITQAGFGTQPNAFDSAAIENEVVASCPNQPLLNLPIGQSATWQSIFGNAVAGQVIATPYHDVKVTDPNKLAQMTRAYQQWTAGKVSDLPDIRDVFLDAGLREMGFAPQAGLDGRTLLQQMCQQCHNANLDPTISRDNFLVDQLDTMSRAEKDLAIQRLLITDNSRLRMPPFLFRTVTDDEIQLMVQELQK